MPYGMPAGAVPGDIVDPEMRTGTNGAWPARSTTQERRIVADAFCLPRVTRLNGYRTWCGPISTPE